MNYKDSIIEDILKYEFEPTIYNKNSNIVQERRKFYKTKNTLEIHNMLKEIKVKIEKECDEILEKENFDMLCEEYEQINY